MQMPELVNLNDSNTSFTEFINKIPEEIDEPFDYKIQNGLILNNIINKIIKNPQKQDEVKVYINDVGYDKIHEINSILGITFKINKHLEELFQEQTQKVMDKYLQLLPKEKEGQKEIIIKVQIDEFEQMKIDLQQQIIDQTIQTQTWHRDDIRQGLFKDLIKQKQQNIKMAQKCLNLLNDQQMFRETFKQFIIYIEELVQAILRLETTLSYRTQRYELQLKMSQNEREQLQSQTIQKLRNQVFQKDQQILEIQNQIHFTLSHYNSLENQISNAKGAIQRQIQQIKKQKEEMQQQLKTSSPSQNSQVRDTSKSNLSDNLDIIKQQNQIKKSSTTYAQRARYKTIFVRR